MPPGLRLSQRLGGYEICPYSSDFVTYCSLHWWIHTGRIFKLQENIWKEQGACVSLSLCCKCNYSFCCFLRSDGEGILGPSLRWDERSIIIEYIKVPITPAKAGVQLGLN